MSGLRRYLQDPFCALSHFFGLILAVFGLLTLIQRSGDKSLALVTTVIYGTSLIILFLASGLIHSIDPKGRNYPLVERLDYAAIFLLIAGTYTPVCLLIIGGWLGLTLLILEWSLAAAGIWSLFSGRPKSRRVQVFTYLAMGWLFLITINPIVEAVSNELLMWLLGGALFYSVGSICFLTNYPILWKKHFEAHELWHVMVLGGSICHFIFISEYIALLNQAPMLGV